MTVLIKDRDQSFSPTVEVSYCDCTHVPIRTYWVGLLIYVSCTAITSSKQFRFIHTSPFYPSGKKDLSSFYVHLTVSSPPLFVLWRRRCGRYPWTSIVLHRDTTPACLVLPSTSCQLMVFIS